MPPHITDISVCVTCREAGSSPDAARPGAALYQALRERLQNKPEARLHGVECLAVCTRPCTVAVSGAGKWTYVVGGLHPAQDIDEFLAYVALYAASPHGALPLKERPACIRKGVVARIPPSQS